MVGWVVGTTALYKRLDSIQTSLQSTGKFCTTMCSKRSVLLSEIRDHLVNFSSIHSYESLWMDGRFCWMAVLSAIH